MVTKPARKTEIVIGRMLGFSSLMTIMVVVMGTTGYIWIDREVAHNLTVYSQSFEKDGQETLVEYVEGNEGVTVRVTAGDNPTTVTTAASRQVLRQDNLELFNLTELARAAALKRHLVAKRPVLGTLSFTGADGSPTELGVNTGDIWEYRTYIAGGTQWRAIWDFENITGEVVRRAKGLRLESSFEAFRTHKGDNIQASLLLQYTLVKIDRSVFRDSNDRPVSAVVVRKTGENSYEAAVDGQVTSVTPVPVPAHELMVKGNTYVLVDDPDVVVRVISKARVPLPSFNISEFGENVHGDPVTD